MPAIRARHELPLGAGQLAISKRNFSFCLAVGIIYWLMTWTFANLEGGLWLEIPKAPQITRGLTQTPRR